MEGHGENTFFFPAPAIPCLHSNYEHVTRLCAGFLANVSLSLVAGHSVQAGLAGSLSVRPVYLGLGFWAVGVVFP